MKKIFTITGLIIFFGLLIVSPLIIKVKIDCQSQYGQCPQQILDKIGQYNGKNIAAAKNGIRKILKSDYLVSDYSIQFKLPNILHAELLVKKATVAIGNNVSGPFILVDKDGLAIDSSPDSALPVITIADSLPKIGQNIGTVNLFALNLARGIYQMYQIRETSIQDGSLLVELPGQIRVIFPLDGDSDILLGSLRLIYSKIQSDGNSLKYSQIDLRFKNPVLR